MTKQDVLKYLVEQHNSLSITGGSRDIALLEAIAKVAASIENTY